MQAQGDTIKGDPAVKIAAGGAAGLKNLSFAYGTGQAEMFEAKGEIPKLEFVLNKRSEGSTLVCTCNIGDADA